MSEKRFVYEEEPYHFPIKKRIRDTQNNETYIYDLRECCELLNEQQATIQSLKEDNEQLKKEYKIAIDEMVTDYKKLEKENEQLQKDVENLQEVVAELGATLLLNGFEIKINDENLSEMIDDE